MKQIITFLLTLSANFAFAQNDINWDGKYQLQLSDFKSPATKIGEVNNYSIYAPFGIDFSFAMTGVQFVFTKNFNSKVNNLFKPKASALVAPNEIIASDLVNLANYQFDLAELYCRKFRKRLFEEKAAFSEISFFKSIYDELQNDYSERVTNAGKESDLGRKKDKLKILHEQTLKEIQELNDFCKDCKSLKKKK